MRLAGVVAIGFVLVTFAGASGAEALGAKTLQRVEVIGVESGHELIVTFDRPLRYVRHSPNDRGKLVRIELAELGSGAVVEDGERRRESLPPPPGHGSPLVEVLHERDRDGELAVVLRFSRVTHFEIQPSRDARSLSVLMKREASKPGRTGQILDEAGRAMTAREYPRAISLYELVLSAEAHDDVDREHQQEAHEYLGLAHERGGQLAHARAEYEAYLERYPEGDGSDRVRQRLDALMTAMDAPRDKLRAPREAEDESPVEWFGDLAVGYYRNENLLGDREDPVYESTLISDLVVTARGEVSEWELTGDLAVSHDEGFERPGDQSDTRVSRLSVEAQTPGRDWNGIVGRQTKRDGGVLGRFDGAALEARVHERVTVGGVFGFPLETTTSTSIETERIFAGLSTDIDLPIEGGSAHLFTIGQANDELVDRLAVGAELHYVHRRGYARAFFDFDAYYHALNLALLSGSIEVGEATRLNALLQTQTVPFFTLASALQGQAARDLDDLRDDFSKSEIRDLAKDRTAQSYTASLGGSHWITNAMQIAADLSFITVGKTNASDGPDGGDEGSVPASDGTDGDISTSLQLTYNDLFGIDDISSTSVRYTNGEISDAYRVLVRTRLPVTSGLHFDPRLSVAFRDHRQGGEDVLTVMPTARMVWDWQQWSLELELGLESREFFGTGSPDHELGYLADILIRWEF